MFAGRAGRDGAQRMAVSFHVESDHLALAAVAGLVVVGELDCHGVYWMMNASGVVLEPNPETFGPFASTKNASEPAVR